jgi:hypothetical protein
MLHWWLIPLMALFVLAVVAFYLIVRFTGGSGIRTEGRTLVDKPSEEEDDKPSS